MKTASSICGALPSSSCQPIGQWLSRWLARRTPRPPVLNPDELERYLHEDSVPMRQRLSAAKKVLRWAKGLEEEQLAEIVEFMEQLEFQAWPAHS